MHLTTREKQVLEHVVKGEKREAVAAALGISPWTVDFHLENARRKLNVPTTLQLCIFFVCQPAEFRSYQTQELMPF